MSENPGEGRRLLNATAVMASGTMVSRGLGLVRAMLIAFVLGNSGLKVDVFTLAMTVPSSLYLLLAGGTLNNVLVPQIVRAVNHDADGGKAFVDRIMTGFLIALGALTAVFTLAAPLVMSIYTRSVWRTPEMAAPWQSLLLMSYLTMPQVFFYGVFFLIGQVLNAREKFGPMMWAPIVNNVVSIAVFGLYLGVWGTQPVGATFTDQQVWLLGLGSTAGIAVQTAVLIPYLKRAGFSYRPRFDLKGTGLGRTFHVAKWMVGYVALTSLAQVVVTNLGSVAAPAAAGVDAVGAGVNVYQQAYLIWVLPHSLLTVSLATAMLPTASKYAVAGDRTQVAAEINRALRLASTFIVPASVGLAVLADPITRLIFGNGSGARDYHLVAWALLAFAIGLVPFTIQYLYLRAFYALDNTKTPFLLQIWISGANALFAIALVMAWEQPQLVATQLALSYSLAYLLGVFLTHRALRHRLPELGGRSTWQHLIRLAVASIPAAVLAWLVTWWFDRYPGTLLRAVGLALAALLAVLAFFFTAKRLGIPEASDLVGVLRRAKPDGGEADAAETIGDEAGDQEADQGLVTDPDGAGVFVPVEPGVAPPSEPTDFPEPALSDQPPVAVLGDRYQLQEQLAVRGGTQTWRAQDLVLTRPVLVHLLAADDPLTEDALRLAREAALATDARFLRVLDVVDEPASAAGAYLVYEYAAGQTLEKVLRSGPLTGLETAWVVREAADALSSLHAQGHSHRQLSPASLLITTSGNVKILGFGANGAAAEPAGGETADVRALGRLLYAGLCGRWPDGARFGLPAGPIVDGRLLLPSEVRGGVSPAVDQIVDRILSGIPRAHRPRLHTAAEVTTQLSLVLGPVSAAHDLRARLQPAAATGEPAPLVSTVAPPVPTPAASRLHASAPLSDPEPRTSTSPFVDAALDRSEPFTPVPPPAGGTAPAATTGSRRVPPVLLLLIGLVVVGGLVAAIVNGIGNRPAAAPPTSGPLAVVTATDFDPKADGGSGRENRKQAKLAIDGDLKTGWRTERYKTLPTLGGLKPGVGLVLDLGQTRLVDSVQLRLAGSPTSVELRVPAAEGDIAPTTSVQKWRLLHNAADAGVDLEWRLEQPTQTRFLLVYLTSLPPVGEGYFRGEIREVTVHGR